MTNIITSDYELDHYCTYMAQFILEDITKYGGSIRDLCHEMVDSSDHVIYPRFAHSICQNCNIDKGEEYVNAVVDKFIPYNTLATFIVYGEIYNRLLEKCLGQEKIDD